MKQTELKYTLYAIMVILAIGIGVYAYNSAQERELIERCFRSTLGSKGECL